MFVLLYFIIWISVFDFVYYFYVKILLLIRLVCLLFELIRELIFKVGNLYIVYLGLFYVVWYNMYIVFMLLR